LGAMGYKADGQLTLRKGEAVPADDSMRSPYSVGPKKKKEGLARGAALQSEYAKERGQKKGLSGNRPTVQRTRRW